MPFWIIFPQEKYNFINIVATQKAAHYYYLSNRRRKLQPLGAPHIAVFTKRPLRLLNWHRGPISASAAVRSWIAGLWEPHITLFMKRTLCFLKTRRAPVLSLTVIVSRSCNWSRTVVEPSDRRYTMDDPGSFVLLPPPRNPSPSLSPPIHHT